MRTIFLFLIVPLLIGSSCNVKHDTAVYSAIDAGDITAIFSGCGEKHRDGIVLCRVSENGAPTTSLTITLPQLKCERETCANVDVIGKDGSIRNLGSIPKGKTSLSFSLSDILGDPNPISKEQGGPYRVLIEAYFQMDGEEWKVMAKGIIYLLVLKPGYVSVGCNGPDIAWKVKLTEQCEAHYTTKMRTVLCGEECHGSGD